MAVAPRVARPRARLLQVTVPEAELEPATIEGALERHYVARTDAIQASADAQADQARAIRELIEAFRPAADAIGGASGRLDALCKWLKSAWPWVCFIGVLLASRVINIVPDNLGRAAEMATGLAQKAFQ
ncbi:MAG: hypothetical protein JSR98_00700 [Proteobacteria bacterium]|nr:hypothetical protein [Pseudomonadota bacterium]